MHKNIDLTLERDFAVTKDTFDFLQTTYKEIMEAIMSSGSQSQDYMIVAGVEEDGGNHTAGWMVIEGELLPFVSGATQTTVIIVENIVQAPWREVGGAIVNKDTYYSRHVEFGVGAGQIDFADFKRMEFARTINDVHDGHGYIGNANSPLGGDWAMSATKTIFEKDQFNNIKIQGMIEYTGISKAAAGDLMFTLASGYRPTHPSGAGYIYFKAVSLATYEEILCRVVMATGVAAAVDGQLVNGEYYWFDFNFVCQN